MSAHDAIAHEDRPDERAPTPADPQRQPAQLIRRAQQVHTAMWAAQVSSEVTSTQFAVLKAIARQPLLDQNTLSREAHLDTSTVADVVNRLHARGLLERTRDAVDRRRNLLTLTESGQRLYEGLQVAATAMTERLVGCLSEEDRRDLVRILTLLVEAGEA